MTQHPTRETGAPSKPSADQVKQDRQETPSEQPHKTHADPSHKATRFDGDPQVQGAENSPSGLKPKDDTPAFLEKREGPKK